MVNAAKGFLYLQSGTAHVETIKEVGDDEKPLKDKSIMKCCYYCHLIGHFAAECRKRKADQVANRGKGRGNSRVHFGSYRPRNYFIMENVHNVGDTSDEEKLGPY